MIDLDLDRDRHSSLPTQRFRRRRLRLIFTEEIVYQTIFGEGRGTIKRLYMMAKQDLVGVWANWIGWLCGALCKNLLSLAITTTLAVGVAGGD